MADDDVLSRAQINSLLMRGSDEDDCRQHHTTVEGRRVRAFAPASRERLVRERLRALDMINQRFACDLRLLQFNLLRSNAGITIDSVKIRAYSEFIRNLAVLVNINLFSMKPLCGNTLLMFPLNLVFLVVGSLFNGDGRFSPARKSVRSLIPKSASSAVHSSRCSPPPTAAGTAARHCASPA